MNVSGIRPYEGFYQYNSIKLNELRNQQIAATQQPEAKPSGQSAQADVAAREQELAAAAARQTFGSLDYAGQYRSDETFDLKGIDSDLAGLDMAKAVSDLDKDQVLQQYQYFVGTEGGAIAKGGNPSDAILRAGENFML